MISCQVERTPMGWYLTFPTNPSAGLIFFTDSEKVDFVTSCQIDIGDENPLLVDLTEITQCPEYWHTQALNFEPPF